MFAFAKSWGAARVLDVAAAPGDRARTGRTGVSLSLEDVSHRVKVDGSSVSVLEEVSLRIAAGEFVCVVGPSGSGKSTLLNLLAGLARPAAGTVRAAGRNVEGPAPERALVFQDAALFPWLTLRQNVEFPLRLRGVPRGERAGRSEELLRLVHLWRFRANYPHELSGGMRQRGAIARALAADPGVLLMDEPFAALDAQTREILQGELERIWCATRKTIVFVTHNVREAVRLGDRVVLMGTRPGRLLYEAPIDLPRPRPANDAQVAELANEVSSKIAGEVAKVAREEADDAWLVPGDRIRSGSDRRLGRAL
jgi:sulfonate transport system ATP-binding protein